MTNYRYNAKCHSRRKHAGLRRFAVMALILLCCALALATVRMLKNFQATGTLSGVWAWLCGVADGEYDSSARSSDRHSDETGGAAQSSKDAQWNLILVNRWNEVPDDYEVEFTELSNGQLVDSRIYPDLQAMFNTARSEYVFPTVVSGYRSEDTQQRLFDEKIAEGLKSGLSDKDAAKQAESWVAIPGTSEHQLAIAVDVGADAEHTGEESDVYAWLAQNAYKFGFIYRYQADKTHMTGINDEPWHYRYVGIEAAFDIHSQGISLEEYLP